MTDPGLYLYGVIRWPVDPRMLQVTGIGSPPLVVRAVSLRSIAALVSDILLQHISFEGPRELRRDMKAHARLVNQLTAENLTILPARFGIVLPDQEVLVHQFLKPQFEILEQSLARVDGAVEVKIKALSSEEAALSTVLTERPDLRQASAQDGSFDDRIEIGRLISQALKSLSERDADRILAELSPLARDASVGKRLSDLTALNASFLVERHRLAEFDRAVQSLRANLGSRIDFDYVGPLAPFSFVKLSV